MTTTYNEIIHGDSSSGGASSLKTNLINFRKWATKSANITVHGALTIVNGEATDGTRNAPVLVFESTAVDPRSSSTDSGKDGLLSGGGNKVNSSDIRCGAIDNTQDRNMYDRSIGCQVRTCRDLKKDEIALSIPRSAMITPDLIIGSDAGLAIFNCIQQPQPSSEGGGEHEFIDSDSSNNNYWKAFGNTAKLEKLQAMKIQQNSGTQLLVKILQERKKVETVLNKAQQIAVERNQGGGINSEADTSKLVQSGVLSYRAPFLAFLIHQRFANEHKPLVSTSSNNLPEGTPDTFAPYARTLPSSICVPICWKRNELALLAGCIPGMPALQKVAARTMQLSSELINLVNAGILYKYPNVFSEGMITWDRWVWAAAVYESRALMTSSLPSWFMDGSAMVNSPSSVWENCGVLIPFLDMLNHEDDAAQTQWHRSALTNEGGEDTNNDASMTTTATQSNGRLNIITTRKTKKHEQIYRNYGCLDNEQFMQQFGFTRMSNPADKVRIAWALVDGVGNVDPPTDYEAVSNNDGLSIKQHVFESLDADSVKSWWTEQRISLLGKVTNNDETLESLRKGKKITFCAYNNGKIDPYLLAVAIVATLPPEKVMEVSSLGGNNNNGKPLDGLILDKACQNSVRMYLSFLFAKKLGKLLQSLNSCLKDHFNSVQLWTKATKGGLNYVSNNDNDSSTMSSSSVDGGEKSAIMGWQTFFDTYAWYSTMEVEERYYSMAPDSCVLTLYDGHVRSLQNSLDVMTTDAVFHDNVKQQLVDLGCTADNTSTLPTPIVKNENAATQAVVTQSPAAEVVPDKDMDERVTVKSSSSNSKDNEKKAAAQDPSPPKNDKQDNNNSKVGEGGTTNKRGDRHKSNKKGDRPPAIKLHIGNLSYKTLPNQLYDFFTKLYGKDSVLECHIPTERDTGNSRGFGFVTMPENDAKRALESGNTHEMDGRILKVAESNSAGGGRGRGGNGGGGRNAPPQNDRCQQCGYRPRWCTCNPNMMPMNHHSGGGGMGGPPDTIYGPGPYNNNMPLGPPMGPGGGYGYPNEMDGGFGWGGGSSGGGGNDRGGGGGGGWSRYSRSRSPSYRRSDRDRGYRHRSRSYSYSRSRSRSYSRDRHHRGGRHHDDDRGRRYDDDRRRGSSRRYRSRSRSRSPGRVNEDSVGDQKSGERERSLSRSRSPNKNGDQGGGKRKRDRSRRRRKRSRKDRRSRS